MKKNWIIAIIIFLLVSNLALITTLLIKQSNIDTSELIKRNKPIRELPDKESHEKRDFEEKITRDLDLSKEQVEKLQSLSVEFHHQRKKLKRTMNQLKEEHFSQLAVKNPNEDSLRELADSLGNLFADIVLLEYNHYQDIKSICTPEQANKLDSLGKLHMHKYKYKNKGYQRRQNYSGNN